MTFDQFRHQSNALLRRRVWKSDQSGVWNVMQIYQLPEVRINGNQDTTVRFCKFQQSPIPGISPEFPSFHNVMSGAAKPLGKTTTCGPIYKESHGFATDTAARESPAMTAWA